jgi:glycosidase
VPHYLETFGAGSDTGADTGPDTAPDTGTDGKAYSDPHAQLRELRTFTGRRRGDAVLLGEVNLPHDAQMAYFGSADGEELIMQFDFVTNQVTFLALARQDARALAGVLRDRPEARPTQQWAMFLRNHDELTLDKLTEEERADVFAAFGPEPRMQIFGRGLRRRLPPMLGDPRRARMAYSLLFSLPGTPVLYYGEEIGMGENLEAEGRHSVRTPMQWSSAPNAGFSTADASALPTPLVEGEFGPERVNVASQRRDPASTLAFFTELIRRYRECPELGWGSVAVTDQEHPSVLAHCCTWAGATLIAAHNLADEPRPVCVALDDAAPGTALADVLGCEEGEVVVGDDGAVRFDLPGYGFRWLRLVRGDQRLL